MSDESKSSGPVSTSIVFTTKEGKAAEFAETYKNGPFAYLTAQPGVIAYHVLLNEGENKVQTTMVFESEAAFKTAIGTEAFDKSKAGLHELLNGKPAFSKYKVYASFPKKE